MLYPKLLLLLQVLSLASLADSRWINLAELEDLTLEKVSENDLKEKT